MRGLSLAAVVAAAVTLFATVTAQAQSGAQRVNVPFKFSLAERSYPAAQYFFRFDSATESVEVLGSDKKMLTRAKVITRLALPPGSRPDGKIRLVFDQLGEDRYLSEVWIPGSDGLLLRATSEHHKHETVSSPN